LRGNVIDVLTTVRLVRPLWGPAGFPIEIDRIFFWPIIPGLEKEKAACIDQERTGREKERERESGGEGGREGGRGSIMERGGLKGL